MARLSVREVNAVANEGLGGEEQGNGGKEWPPKAVRKCSHLSEKTFQIKSL